MVNGTYVPYSEEYGIYKLDVNTGETHLVYSSPLEITNIDLSPDGSKFALCMYHGDGYEYSEIYTMNIDGTGLTQLTDNDNWDLYPNWSPDGSEFVFLSWRESSLDIYKMDADGSYQFSYTPEQLGEYSIQAEWAGDLGHSGSTSASIGFTVQEETPPDEGIPGYPVISMILGLAIYLMSRRHSYLGKTQTIF